MDKQTIEKVAEELESWRNKNHRSSIPRLEVHEAIKAFLLMQGEPGARLEQRVLKYDHLRNGRFDYVDDNSVIEVDDGPDIKTIKKLVHARDVLGKQPYWILALNKGKGGKARWLSMQAKIPLFRIYIRNNCYFYEWSEV
jgi:hypothetical protein